MQIILVYILLATVRNKCCSYEFTQYKVCRLSEPLARSPLLGSRGLGSIIPQGSVQGTAEHPASSKARSPVEVLHPEVCSAFLLHINTTISAWRSNQPQCRIPVGRGNRSLIPRSGRGAAKYLDTIVEAAHVW